MLTDPAMAVATKHWQTGQYIKTDVATMHGVSVSTIECTLIDSLLIRSARDMPTA
jgi:hypothetical protein